MKFLKKPAVAVVIAVILVLSSSFISVNAKLGAKCREVTDIFYSGMRYNNEFHPAIAEQLRSICTIANDLCVIAGNYDIDSQGLEDARSLVESAIVYSANDAGYIYYEYSGLRSELKSMTDKLSQKELTARHSKLLTDYEEQLKTFEYNIDTAGYNEAVRAFLQEYDRMPTRFFADICGVQMPEYFA